MPVKTGGIFRRIRPLADFDKEADLMFDLLLINGCVITVDSAHTVYQPGYVAVEKDTIAAIGPMSDLPCSAGGGSGHRPCAAMRFCPVWWTPTATLAIASSKPV